MSEEAVPSIHGRHVVSSLKPSTSWTDSVLHHYFDPSQPLTTVTTPPPSNIQIYRHPTPAQFSGFVVFETAASRSFLPPSPVHGGGFEQFKAGQSASGFNDSRARSFSSCGPAGEAPGSHLPRPWRKEWFVGDVSAPSPGTGAESNGTERHRGERFVGRATIGWQPCVGSLIEGAQAPTPARGCGADVAQLPAQYNTMRQNKLKGRTAPAAEKEKARRASAEQNRRLQDDDEDDDCAAGCAAVDVAFAWGTGGRLEFRRDLKPGGVEKEAFERPIRSCPPSRIPTPPLSEWTSCRKPAKPSKAIAPNSAHASLPLPPELFDLVLASVPFQSRWSLRLVNHTFERLTSDNLTRWFRAGPALFVFLDRDSNSHRTKDRLAFVCDRVESKGAGSEPMFVYKPLRSSFVTAGSADYWVCCPGCRWEIFEEAPESARVSVYAAVAHALPDAIRDEPTSGSNTESPIFPQAAYHRDGTIPDIELGFLQAEPFVTSLATTGFAAPPPPPSPSVACSSSSTSAPRAPPRLDFTVQLEYDRISMTEREHSKYAADPTGMQVRNPAGVPPIVRRREGGIVELREPLRTGMGWFPGCEMNEKVMVCFGELRFARKDLVKFLPRGLSAFLEGRL
ncbi:hypothetical protein BDK51DRAFT_41641 [Blyttiomyces helicus]|uniref:F-box domain-containing protein n=1 Tax=Blyttiomyces helicus TaxID=388810 RepID=A0A4P9WIU3_9FUNG|nr:hypothetical protein BDK51DRAFT_41641 [Blyttiomyces helicus]|eukprot:RKO90496.1 hypothetical protein BDK51DRAFT_41641 [Blyttiomyces helicus]